ncbi:MAG: type transport system ATP-binding protein [Nocardioidaceae bacterium]|nr:type transport system ATP-binding protein [Nocardioidaceae bacterium]
MFGPLLVDECEVMIELHHLTKTYAGRPAVDDLTVDIHPGRVTGFLGPNGAGKSTTLRMLLGLCHPTSGDALINGCRYRELVQPLCQVGAHLDGSVMHPGRSARAHLLGLARTHRLGRGRVDEVLERVGLTDVAGRRVGSFSLGMTQRLGIAAALIGDPDIVVLDEPVNGLDTDGVRWIRQLLRGLADEGRTVLVSSHLLAEMQNTADQVVVLGRGRLLADCPTSELVTESSAVLVRSPDREGLARLQAALDGATITRPEPDAILVDGSDAGTIGDLAALLGVRLHLLAPAAGSLEDGYVHLVEGHLDYTAKEAMR